MAIGFTNAASGGSKPSSNLLHNWYFKKPVNQRAQSTYSTINAYSIDRWKLTSGSVSVVSGGISLNGTIIQILDESIGLPVVASALLSDGTMITPTYDDATHTFTLTASNKIIVAVKLEIGNSQTLAKTGENGWQLTDIPSYKDQLTECQRYYYRINVDQWETIALGQSSAARNISITLPCPAMRALPAISTGHTFVVDGGTGSGTRRANVASYSLRYHPDRWQMSIDIAPANDVVLFITYFVRCETNDSYWEFTADL